MRSLHIIYKYKSEPWTKVCTSEDWTKAALDLLGGKAGITGEFKYSTLGIHILTGIIAKTSGMKTVEFANRYLFEPLGIPAHSTFEALTAKEHRAFVLSKEPKKTYGYLWWTPDSRSKAYAAIGDGGNVIYINPEQNIVAAVGATFKPRIFDRMQFIQEYVEPML